MDDTSLRQACRLLEEKVRLSGGKPDAILSIRRGGEYVGAKMFSGLPHFAVTLRRPGTRVKSGRLKRVLRLMPRPLLDRLRILESWCLAQFRAARHDDRRVKLPDLSGYGCILIVDDAVDSGATLSAVSRAVRTRHPHARLLAAAVTVTTVSPVAMPDYYIYNNLTLIRFPWSADV